MRLGGAHDRRRRPMTWRILALAVSVALTVAVVVTVVGKLHAPPPVVLFPPADIQGSDSTTISITIIDPPKGITIPPEGADQKRIIKISGTSRNVSPRVICVVADGGGGGYFAGGFPDGKVTIYANGNWESKDIYVEPGPQDSFRRDFKYIAVTIPETLLDNFAKSVATYRPISDPQLLDEINSQIRRNQYDTATYHIVI